MRVLVVGAGGREHALCWALSASPLLTRLWCAPGNPGTAQVADNVPIGALDIAALVAFARENGVDLVVPGPEAPLVAGSPTRWRRGDRLLRADRRSGAPRRKQEFHQGNRRGGRHPDRAWERFDDAEAAREFVRRRGAPIVVKADGLAAERASSSRPPRPRRSRRSAPS